jgi:hypothetical protein
MAGRGNSRFPVMQEVFGEEANAEREDKLTVEKRGARG